MDNLIKRLPSKQKGEQRAKFLERCMGDTSVVSDFPGAAQRFAVCTGQADKKKTSIPFDQIQSIVLSKTQFPTKEDAEMFLESNGYTKALVVDTEHSFIYTQKPETAFVTKSFETMELNRGVAVVCGTPVPLIRKSFDINKPFSEVSLGEYDEIMHRSHRPESLGKKDLEEYFECKYAQLTKVVDGVSPYRANLFRFGFNGISKEIEYHGATAYDDYDESERAPVEYISFSTGDDMQEGIFEGAFFLSIGEEKICMKVSPAWGGAIAIKYFAIEKSTVAKFQNQIQSYIEENNFMKGKKLYADGSFIKLPNVGWDDIILPDEVRESIQKNVIDYVTRIPELKAKGLPVKRGLLLHGDPGNGKTMLGKVLANTVDCTFIWLPYSADNESTTYKDIFDMARELAPSIVLMEDLASQGGMDRRSYGGQVSSSLGQLLNILDGVEENEGVITIATENYVDNLDIALRNRPGRFDIILNMPNPALEQRTAILAKLLPEYPGARINALAHKSNGMSCVHLRELATRLIVGDEPVDRDVHIIDDMVKTFGINVGGKEVIISTIDSKIVEN